jgi:very-short-patch-repair endonuclease
MGDQISDQSPQQVDSSDIQEEQFQTVEEKLDISRRELLDLSLYNKLINYRPLKSKGVEIVDEISTEVFRILVTDGKSMSFLSKPEEDEKEPGQEIFFTDEQVESNDELGQPDEDENGLAARHTDIKLQTSYTSKVLQKRLLNTYYSSRTYIEEQGVNILYLAIGMLHWYESQSSEIMRQAPLILVPVEINRSSVRSNFRIKYTDEEIGENLSLRAKMQSDFGIMLPEFPEDDEIDILAYAKKIRRSVRIHPRWEVDPEALNLGFFSFGKFLMYNDLDSNHWSEDTKPEDNPILRSLLHEGFDDSDLVLSSDMDIDEYLSPEQIHNVVDADSSQIMAILEVNNGRNLVIQGPPGTGKSQTITNLIAEAIGRDKTVLFVSEKMAALEVVKRRLDHVGLGDACLELHSQKTKKRIFLDELNRSLNLGKPITSGKVDILELKRNQDKLNGYSKAVNDEIGVSELTPYEVYGRIIQVKEILSGVELPKIKISEAAQWTREEAQRNLSIITELQLFIRKIGRPTDHQFWGSQISVILPSENDRLVQLINDAIQSLDVLQKKSSEVSDFMMLQAPISIDEVQTQLEISDYLQTGMNLKGINVHSESWLAKASDIEQIVNTGKRIAEIRKAFERVLIDDAWNQEIMDIARPIKHYGTKWWRVFSGDYRDAKRRLSALCRVELPETNDRQLQILKAIHTYQKLKPIIEDFTSEGSRLFGDRMAGLDSDWDELLLISSWLAELHKQVNNGELPSQTIDFVATYPDLSILEHETTLLRQSLRSHRKFIGEIITALKLDESVRFGEGEDLVGLGFAMQDNILNDWSRELFRLQDIVTLNDLVQRLPEVGLDDVVTLAVSWTLAGKHLVDHIELIWLSDLIERAMVERPILASFDGQIHEHSLVKFCELDTTLLNQNRIRLAYEHWNTLPKYRSSGQLGVLYHEFAKKRRHKPIRKLIIEAGNVIQVIKPIFMMSPLSIAMFLPPDTIGFDVIIFDEASQVKPVDAFGAIMRGKQIVVVGDDRQLPPTTFFESAIDVDDDYSESITVDLESILGLCVSQGIPQKMLRWHYRSQHESLITVSNYEFYDDKLVVFPSPNKEKKELGLVYHYLPDTEYGRGRSRSNLGEARHVAQAVMGHAQNYPDLSLGVAAFSVSQMEAIRDQLEILRRQDPSKEKFFHSRPEEPFFVKNLENVQGDERDVIFISVGYGRTTDGRISMNFGPINQEGGERRLNVLITRARKRCEVFTNLKANDIDLSRTKSRGVQVLKRFLNYADTGHLDIPLPTNGDAESPFEEVVASELKRLGYRIEHQVGSRGFFIDIAVIDDEHPGRYLLGIECDGASYHSARSARDRDRLRQEVLENLGWTLHRIWSTDWFRNPERETQLLVKSIEATKIQSVEADKKGNPNPNNPKRKTVVVERQDPKQQSTPAIHVQEYKTAPLNIPYFQNILHEVSAKIMAGWIKDVVDVESPVHEDEVIRRIVNAAGVKRVGNRIRSNFEFGLSKAVREELVTKRGEFIWQMKMKQPKIRSRSKLPNKSRRIYLIAPEEIFSAILEVVKFTYGIQRDMIPNEACNLFGFKRVTQDIYEHIDNLVGDLVMEG